MVTGHIRKEISAHCSLQESPPLGSLLREELAWYPQPQSELLVDSGAESKRDGSLCWLFAALLSSPALPRWLLALPLYFW